MSTQVSEMPDIDKVRVVANSSESATIVRVVLNTRRLDRFWQMVRDETDGTVSGLGTYTAPGSETLSMVLVEINKPDVTDRDLEIFSKYRFKPRVMSTIEEAMEFGELGKASAKQYVAPEPKNSTSSAFS